jgi:hypothetical protein
LNVDQDAIEPLTSPTTRVIKIGDLVRKAWFKWQLYI